MAQQACIPCIWPVCSFACSSLCVLTLFWPLCCCRQAWCSWAPPAALLLLPSPNLVLGLAHLLAAQILLWGILVPTWRSQPPAAARVAAVHCTLRLVLPLAHLAAAGWDLWQQQQQQQQEQPQADGVPPAAVHVLGGAGWSGRLGVECSLQALLLRVGRWRGRWGAGGTRGCTVEGGCSALPDPEFALQQAIMTVPSCLTVGDSSGEIKLL
jgi:hypothetical protein